MWPNPIPKWITTGVLGGVGGSTPAYLLGGVTLSDVLAAYEPKGAASQAASYLSKTGSNNAIAADTPGWDTTNGWKFNGTSNYLTTSILGQAGMSIIISLSNNASSSRANIVGATDGAVGGLAIETVGVVTSKTRFGHGSAIQEISPKMTQGILAITPTKVFFNGYPYTTNAQNWSGVTPKNLWIGCKNVNGSPGLYNSVYVQALYIYSAALSDAQVLAISDAMPQIDRPVLGFGDSITAGFGVADSADWFINKIGVSLGKTVVNAGISGTHLQNTVQNTVATIGGAAQNNGRDTYLTRVVTYSPEYVFIEYGINDLRLNDVAYTDALYQNDLGEIVDDLILHGIPASKIVIGAPSYIVPTEYGNFSTPYDAGTLVNHQAYIAAASAVATAKGVGYADLYQAISDGGGSSLLQSQPSPHPTAAGHTVMANAFLAAL